MGGSVKVRTHLTPDEYRETLAALISQKLRDGRLMHGVNSHYTVAIAMAGAARFAMQNVPRLPNADEDDDRLLANALVGAVTDVINADFMWENNDPIAIQKQVRASMSALHWLCSGLSRIHINSHTYAKALLCSVAPAEPFHLPFDSFELLLPSNLIPKIHRIFVESDGEHNLGIRMTAFNAEGSCMNSGIVTFASMDPELLDSLGYHRCIQAAIFAIRATCLAMADPTDHGVKKIGKGHAQPADAVFDVLGHPIVRTWQLGRPVSVDCGPALDEWLNGKGRSQGPRKVRWLRRGHWTHVVCGTGRVERRLKWIEPHWCGREGAPVLIRPHVLGPRV